VPLECAVAAPLFTAQQRSKCPQIIVWFAVVTVYSPPLVGQAFAIPTGRSPSQFARPALLLLRRETQPCFPIPRSSFAAFGIH
jgi:hypothetical protein